MKQIVVYSVLIKYAHEMAKARKAMMDNYNDVTVAAYKEAERKHSDYYQKCLQADEMIIPDCSDIRL